MRCNLGRGSIRSIPGRAPSISALVVAALLGASFATLWLRERGAWMAFGAHTAWALGTTTVVDGGLLQLRWVASRWGDAKEGLTGGLAVTLALVCVTIAAGFAWYRTRKA